MMTPLLDIIEAAALLRCSRSKLYGRVARGDIEHVREGGQVRFTLEQIQRDIERHTVCLRSREERPATIRLEPLKWIRV
jgi:excisionase family DNA binding protein